MHHHLSILGICLGLAALMLVGCAFGIVSTFQTISLCIGVVLCTAMAGGLFFATLHLQKIR